MILYIFSRAGSMKRIPSPLSAWPLLLVLLLESPCAVGLIGGVGRTSSASIPSALFTDIDGTIVHYRQGFLKHGVTVLREDSAAGVGVLRDNNTKQIRTCRLVPSSTMGSGYISFKWVSSSMCIRLRVS